MASGESDLGVPIDGVVRAAYIVGHVEKFLEMVELAEKVHSVLPQEVKMPLDKFETPDGLGKESIAKIAFELARFPTSVTAALKQVFCEIKHYVGVWVDDEECVEPQFYGMLDEVDVKVIEEMVAFMQKLGKRSSKQLLQFLESANDGDWGCLLLQSKGSDSEVRTKHRLSDQARQEFDLD